MRYLDASLYLWVSRKESGPRLGRAKGPVLIATEVRYKRPQRPGEELFPGIARCNSLAFLWTSVPKALGGHHAAMTIAPEMFRRHGDHLKMVVVLFISAAAFLYGLTAFLFRDQLAQRRRRARL
jgi:hypothetical protein